MPRVLTAIYTIYVYYCIRHELSYLSRGPAGAPARGSYAPTCPRTRTFHLRHTRGIRITINRLQI